MTGATVYIGKHLVRQLLDAGYAVTCSVRSRLLQQDALLQTLSRHVKGSKTLESLKIVELDLLWTLNGSRLSKMYMYACT